MLTPQLYRFMFYIVILDQIVNIFVFVIFEFTTAKETNTTAQILCILNKSATKLFCSNSLKTVRRDKLQLLSGGRQLHNNLSTSSVVK